MVSKQEALMSTKLQLGQHLRLEVRITDHNEDFIEVSELTLKIKMPADDVTESIQIVDIESMTEECLGSYSYTFLPLVTGTYHVQWLASLGEINGLVEDSFYVGSTVI
jgi:hypothetical protein